MLLTSNIEKLKIKAQTLLPSKLTRQPSADSGINETSSPPATPNSNASHSFYQSKQISSCDNSHATHRKKASKTSSYLCSNCSLTICKTCKTEHKYQKTCTGVVSTRQPLFGQALQDTSFVTKTIATIERLDFHKLEGIYRKTGGYKDKQAARAKLDKTPLEALNFGVEFANKPHVLSQLFKDYFRQLPESLIPECSNEPLMAASTITNPEKKLVTVKAILKRDMSDTARRAFSELVKHLARVCLRESDNRMNAHALAIIWTQCIVKFSESTCLQEIKRENDALCGIIEFVISVAADTLSTSCDERDNVSVDSIDDRDHWTRKAKRRSSEFRTAL